MPSASSLKDRLRPYVVKARNLKNTVLHGSCAVLLYHRVALLETDPQLLAVSPQRFERHLALLKKNYHVLSVEEFDHYFLQGKKFPARSVLLTFDDGYADNHHQARPILEQQRMEALFYIASGYIGSNREFWWDEVERLLLVNKELPPAFYYGKGPVLLDLSGTEQGLKPIYDSLLDVLKRMPSKERDAVISDLRTGLNSPAPRTSHLPMTRAELQAFATSPSVVIGAHTVGHPSLASLEGEGQKQEINDSVEALEGILGRKVPYFSYPFGTGADFSDTTEKLAEDAGFKHVAANWPALVYRRSPRFSFPRFLVRDWEVEEFSQRMNTFFRG